MNFADQVKAATDKYRKRMAYTAKTATLAVCNEARETRAKGGKMPVDTGNLRNSMAAAIGQIPSGQTTGNENKTGDEVAAQIIRWQPGKTLFFAGFTANYARYMEYRYGFFRGAVMNWGAHVNRAAAEAVSKIP